MENDPPPLPKRPSQVQSEAAGPVSEKPATGSVPSPRIPARPAPPRPGSRPASVHRPHKDASTFHSQEKPTGGSINKRKIEITVLNARPMSEINFRDMKSSDPKPAASPKVPYRKEENHTSIKKAESLKISGPDLISTQSSAPANREEQLSSPPQPSSDADVETQKTFPPRPKRPTIIRPTRSEKTEKENVEKLQFAKTTDQDNNMPPQKPTRLLGKVDTSEKGSSLSGSETNQSSEQEQQQLELDHPVVSTRPKRPTIIRPGKSVVQDGEKSLTDQKDNDKRKPSLPSRPPQPSPVPSTNVPPPLPSKSPASPPSNSRTFQPESIKDLPKVPCGPSDGQSEKKPIPKPRPRSVAVSSNIDIMSLASKSERKDFPLGGNGKENVMLRSSSPPPLPVKAPRASSVSSEDKISSGITSSDEADTTTSHNVLKGDEKSKEKCPTRPKPPPPAAIRNSHLPARPPPPGRKIVTSHSSEENNHVLNTSDDNKSQQSNRKISSGEFLSDPRKDLEAKDKFSDKEDQEGPIYAKINKTTKYSSVNQPNEATASEAEQEKTCEFPFQVKLKPTLDCSGETQQDEKNSESSPFTSEPGEQQGPRISPKPKPKPSLKPKPQLPIKPKSTTISPRELEVGQISEPALSKSQKSQDNEMSSSPVAEDKTSEGPKMGIRGGKNEEKEKEQDVKSHEKGNEPAISHHGEEDSNVENVNKVKKTWPSDNQRQAAKPGPPLPQKNPDIINQAAGNKENVIKAYLEISSTHSTVDFPSKDKQSCDIVQVDSLRDTVQKNSGEIDTSHIDSAEASSIPPRKKPVRIIGFPHKLSSIKKKSNDVDEGKEEPYVMTERSSTEIEVTGKEATSEKMSVGDLSSLQSDVKKEVEQETEKPTESLLIKPPPPAARPPPPRQVLMSMLNSTTSVTVKDEGTSSGSSHPVARQSLVKPVSPTIMTSRSKSTKDFTLEDEEKHSEPLPPVARPPPPSRISPSVTSKSNSQTNVTEEDKEKNSRPSLSLGSLHSEESDPVTHDTNSEKPASQAAEKPPRVRPPPPRPASIARRKTSESNITDSNHNDKNLTDTLPSHHPSHPVPGRSQNTQSGPPALPPRPGIGHILYNYIANQPHGIALHSYTASQPDELSFQAGETVLLTKQVDDQWMSGRVGDVEGIFPKAFVEIKCALGTQGHSASYPDWHDMPDAWLHDGESTEKVNTITGPRCRARFDFEGCGEGELALEDGDVIQLLYRVGNEWLRGKLHGKEGIFPAAFVEVMEDLPEDQQSSTDPDSKETVAIFDFEGQEGDLAFLAGDKIQVLGQINSEWLYGECNGFRGQFPVSFISCVPSCLPKIEPSSVESNDHDANPTMSKDSSHQISEISSSMEKAPLPVIASCVALHDYESNTPGDLQFKSGEIIEIVEFMGEDWLSGRLHGEEGIFPKVFVELADVLSPEKLVDVPLVGKAVHSFSGRDDTELSFEEGSIIELEEFVDESAEWRWGKFQGHRGMFPSKFVELIR